MSELAPAWNDVQQETPSDLTKNDRFSAVLVLLITLIGLGLGLLIQRSTASQVWVYSNTPAGIDAAYPLGWLTDERGNYVVRILNVRARPYKTQYIISVVPISGQTSIRNIIDSLTLQRSVDFPAYRLINVEEVSSGTSPVTRMEFAFVETDPNPFIERLPVVVQGMDIVFVDGNRAIIVTFMTDRESYDEDLASFERFVASLRY